MKFFSNQTVRRVLAVVFALGLVTTGFIGALGGAFGPTAQEYAEDVNPVEEVEAALATVAIGGLGFAATTFLAAQAYSHKQAVDRVESQETAQQKADLAAGLFSQYESTNQYVVSMENFVEDSRSIASMKAKARMIELINGGVSNETLITQEVDEAIADYYSLRKLNLLKRYKTQFAQMKYAIQTVANDSEMSINFVMNNDGQQIDRNGDWLQMTSGGYQIAQKSVTLDNGSSVSYEVLQAKSESHPDTGTNYWQDVGLIQLSDAQITELRVNSVSHPDLEENVSGGVYFDNTPYRHAWSNMTQAVSDLQTNYDQAFISTVVSQYQAGDINTSDMVTPEMLASEWSTAYNQTGASTYKWANLAALGLESPDLDNVSYMNVTYLKPVGERHVDLNLSGDATESGAYTLSIRGPDGNRNVSIYSDGIGSVDGRLRLRLEAGETAHIQSPGGTWLNFSSRPDQFTSYVEAGESGTIAGIGVSVERASSRDWRSEPGMLFARDAPTGGFVVGETYNPTALDTSVFFTPRGQNTSITKVVGNFTINDAESDSGTQLETVKVQRYNYQTTNASALEEQLTQLSELRKEIESRDVYVTDGGEWKIPGLGISIGAPGMLVIIGIAVALLLGRD